MTKKSIENNEDGANTGSFAKELENSNITSAKEEDSKHLTDDLKDIDITGSDLKNKTTGCSWCNLLRMRLIKRRFVYRGLVVFGSFFIGLVIGHIVSTGISSDSEVQKLMLSLHDSGTYVVHSGVAYGGTAVLLNNKNWIMILPDHKHMMVGSVYDEQGLLVKDGPFAYINNSHPRVSDIVLQMKGQGLADSDNSVNPALGNDDGLSSVNNKQTPVSKEVLANILHQLGINPLNDAQKKQLLHVTGFVQGTSGPNWLIFVDPNCPYCYSYSKIINQAVSTHQIHVAWALVGQMNKNSQDKAVALLDDPHPVDALAENFEHYDTVNDLGGYSIENDRSSTAQKAHQLELIGVNDAVLQSINERSTTPTTVFNIDNQVYALPGVIPLALIQTLLQLNKMNE